ncbi:phage tail protein [Aurantimonas sp. 22II-16-19i]|nr:phage tail protein [Aurantimonas sp. 22II-16-19i]
MTDITELAKEMGRTTQFTANDAALAIEMLAKNGLNASQILGGALKNSMLVAAASGSDLEMSSDLVTDAMQNFGLQAKDLGKVADGISGTLLQSKFGIDDYRLALGQAGGVAGGLGVTIDDFNTSIAGTSSTFASGSDAGTSFKTFLSRLVPASKSARIAMNKLGLEFFKSNGDMKNMSEISEELQEGLEGLSDEARNSYLQDIFGADAIRTAIGLSKLGAEGFGELGRKIASASAQEQADARMKGFGGEWKKMTSALESLSIDLGELALPGATKAVENLRDLIGEIGEGLDQIGKQINWEGIDEAKTSIGDLKVAIEELMQIDASDNGMSKAFKDIATMVDQAASAIKVIADEAENISRFLNDPTGYMNDPATKQGAIENAKAAKDRGDFLNSWVEENVGSPRIWMGMDKPTPYVPSAGSEPAEKGGRVTSVEARMVDAPQPMVPELDITSYLLDIDTAGRAKEALEQPITTDANLNTAAFLAGLTQMEGAAKASVARINAAFGGINAPSIGGGLPRANKAPATTMPDAGQPGGG